MATIKLSLVKNDMSLFDKIKINSKEREKEFEKYLKDSVKQLRANPPKMTIKTGGNIDELPPKLKAIFIRFRDNTEDFLKLKAILQQAFRTLLTHAIQNHKTFCDYFNLSYHVEDHLLKIYQISESELKEEMAKINFFKGQRQLSNKFYQTLAIAYGIGVLKDDPAIRIIVISLIAARLWNGFIKKQFPKGCDPKIAAYVQKYMIRTNSDYKKMGTPFAFIVKYIAPSFDKRYADYVRQNFADHTNGLVAVIKKLQPRIRNVFVETLAHKYYEAYERGLKEEVFTSHSSAYDDGGDVIETKETFKNFIHQIVDKIRNKIAVQKDIIMKEDVQVAIKRKHQVNPIYMDEINEFFNNDEHHEIIVETIEFLLIGLQNEIKDEEDFCKLDPNILATRIGNSKRNQYFNKVKEFREYMAKHIFGKSFEALEKSNKKSTKDKILNLMAYLFIIYTKKLICKKV
jgi:hypothetical protein